MSNDFNITVKCNSNTAAELMALAVEMGGEVISFKKKQKIDKDAPFLQAIRNAPPAVPVKAKIVSTKRRTCFDVYEAACQNYLSTPFTVLQLHKAMKVKDATVSKGSVSAHVFRLFQAGFLCKGKKGFYIVDKQAYTSDKKEFDRQIYLARLHA